MHVPRHQQVCRLCVSPTNACSTTSTSMSTVCESNKCMFHDINKCVDCVRVQQMHVPRHQQVCRLCVSPTNACSTTSTSVSTACESNKCMFHDINKCVDCVRVQQMHVPRRQQVCRLFVSPTHACSTTSTSVSTVCESNKCMFHDINKCVDCV